MALKILHTADWHLGQTFYSYERHDEHEAFLSWLCGQLVAQRADVLLIAGDVFDTPNPSALSQRLFFSLPASGDRGESRVADCRHCGQSRFGGASRSSRPAL